MLAESKDKKKSSRAAERNALSKDIMVRLTAEFSLEAMETRNHWHSLRKVLKNLIFSKTESRLSKIISK
jgi:hypothetical protein